MAIEKLILGGYLDEEIEKINSNFKQVLTDGDIANFVTETEVTTIVNDAVAEITVPTKTSDLTNDSGYQTENEVAAIVDEAIGEAVGGITVPTKTSDLTNDSGFITASAIVNKVDKEAGKGLSTNDYTADDKAKVSKLGKIDFTTSQFVAGSDGVFTATISASGKYPVKVMRSNGSDFEEVLVHTKVSGTNILIVSGVAFDGYVVTI